MILINNIKCYDKFIAPYLVILLLICCKSDKSQNGKHKELKYTKKQVVSYVGSLNDLLGTQVRGTSFFIEDDSTYVTYINISKSKLFKSNLSRPKPTFETIDIPKNLVLDSIYENPTSFSLSGDSLIAIYQRNRISLIDLNREVLLFERDIRFNDSSKIVFQDHFIPIYYNHKKNTIYSQIVHFYNMNSREYALDTEFHSEISIRDDTFEIIPVKYPKSYGNGELDQNSIAKVTYKGDSIIYSFTNEPWILIYNPTSNKQTKIQASSTHFEPLLKMPLDSLWDADKSRKNMILSFRYENIFYDKWNRLFYRVYALSMSEKNKEGFFNTINDKRKGVIILDESFNKLGEIELPDAGVAWYGVGREGFYYQDSFFTKNDSLFKTYVSISPEI